MDDLDERLKAATGALIGRAPRAEEGFGIAVSGGPDSMALLSLAQRCWPGQVAAATVDHGLRPESSAEAAQVARWCEAFSVPHVTLRPDAPISGSVQVEARGMRYALLEDWADAAGLHWLMTAHHADDQLETMLMRLNRASGLAGMAGIRSRRGRWLRPLLLVRKADLVAHCAAAAVPYVTDPSNDDPRFDRARLRGHLASVDWLDPLRAARTAAALADAEAALQWACERAYVDHVMPAVDALLLDPGELPPEMLRRLLQRMLAEVAPNAPLPRGEQIDEALVQLCGGRKLSLGACVVTGGARWTVRRAPARRR